MHRQLHQPGSGSNADSTPAFAIRAADQKDIADFLELALVAGAGFTSLPADEALLANRLKRSKRAFMGEVGLLIVALEDLQAGRVVGCAAIKMGGADQPDFLNFQVNDDLACLSPTSRYSNLTEVGSLLVHPDYRRFGVGRWLARSRYLLMARDPHRFGAVLFSELRGQIEKDETCPFFDGVLAPHFHLTYREADYRCTHGRQGELNAMLPSMPIWLDEIGLSARRAVGCPHRDGTRALWYLEAEGFRYEGVVDLLDGGPLVAARTGDVAAIRKSFEARILSAYIDENEAATMIFAAGKGMDFRSVKGLAVRRGDAVIVSPDLLKQGKLEPGTVVRCLADAPLSPHVAACPKEVALCES